MGVSMLTGSQEIARAFGHMSPHLEHSQRWYGAERQQEAPYQILRQAGGQKSRCQKRSDDEACSLHREHQRYHHAAALFAGKLAHQRGTDGVIAADANAENDAEPD